MLFLRHTQLLSAGFTFIRLEAPQMIVRVQVPDDRPMLFLEFDQKRELRVWNIHTGE